MSLSKVSSDQILRADVVVFSRCRWSEASVRAIRVARASHKVLCGDLDDRIYSPWDASTGFVRSRVLSNGGAVARRGVRNTQRNILRLLPSFDEVLVSTPALQEELQELGLPAHVAPNAIDTAKHPPIARPRAEMRRILFMTGTRTHDADLKVALPGLQRFLLEQPDVELTLLGPVGCPPELVLPRVRTVARLPLEELYRFVADHDVCLVPLESMRFNDCKSPLKFIEAGLVSVPVIASARRAYAAAIRHGENGLLVDDGGSWYAALRGLWDSPDVLRRLSAGAHASVLAEHTVVSRGAALAEHFARLVADGPERCRAPVPAAPRRAIV
jgi:glycosyltransferase involved in cell wall biosynthesis